MSGLINAIQANLNNRGSINDEQLSRLSEPSTCQMTGEAIDPALDSRYVLENPPIASTQSDFIAETQKSEKYSPDYKFAVALAALKGDKSLEELCEEYQLTEKEITDWKNTLLERGRELFERERFQEKTYEPEIETTLLV